MEARGVRSSWEPDLDSCELPGVSAGTLTQVLCQSRMPSYALSPLCIPRTLLPGEPERSTDGCWEGAHMMALCILSSSSGNHGYR